MNEDVLAAKVYRHSSKQLQDVRSKMGDKSQRTDFRTQSIPWNKLRSNVRNPLGHTRLFTLERGVSQTSCLNMITSTSYYEETLMNRQHEIGLITHLALIAPESHCLSRLVLCGDQGLC